MLFSGIGLSQGFPPYMKGSSIEVTTSDRIKRKYSGEKMMMVDREKSRLLHARIKDRIARLQAEIKRLEKKMSKEVYRKHTIVGHAGYGFDGIEAYRFENGLEISESYGFVGGLTYLYSFSPAYSLGVSYISNTAFLGSLGYSF
jgi:uncharacterized small protein (DUF1192 family)